MSEIVVTQAMNGDLNVTETLEGQLNNTDIRYIDRAEFIDAVEDAVEEIGIDYQAQINAEIRNRQNADAGLQTQINSKPNQSDLNAKADKTDVEIFTSDYATSLELDTSKGGLGLNGVKGGSKKSSNLFNESQLLQATGNGITITNNGDGTLTLNGSASAKTFFHLNTNFPTIQSGTYKLVGCPSGANNNYSLNIYTHDTQYHYLGGDTGNGFSATLANDVQITTEIEIANGYTCNNLIFKPMLTTDTSLTYADYEPFGIISSGSLGCVDLGSLTWTRYSNEYWYTTSAELYNSIKRTGAIADYFASIYPIDRIACVSGNIIRLYNDSNLTPSGLLAYETSSTPNQYGLVVKERAEYGCVDLGSLSWGLSSVNGGQFSANFTLAKSVTYPTIKCDRYEIVEVGGWGALSQGQICLRGDLGNLRIQDQTYSDVASFTQAMQGTILYYQRSDETITDKPVIFPLSKPLCSINTIVDEITMQSGKWGVLRRCGMVDLGTLTWTKETSFKSNRIADAYYSGYPRTLNLLCSKGYTPVSSDNATNLTIMLDYGCVRIYDNAYTDAQTFKSAMSGVYLIYELSTPTFEPFADQSIPYQLVAYDTKTYLGTHENLATLSVDYSKSRVGAESLNKVVSDNGDEVYEWAKQPTKPTYTASEVGARPSTWTPSKADIGLGNVDNTADASKSVLYAQTSGGVTGSAKVVVSDTAPSDTSAVWIK